MSDFIIDEKGVLKKYTGAGGDVVIPSDVTKIGKYAFEKCSNLKSVIISEGVTNIDEAAFAFCENLQSVVFSKSVRKIDEVAFYHCRALQDITFPEGITDILGYAFAGCENMKSITIPDSVTNLKKYVFSESARISHCVVAPGLQDEEQSKKLLKSLGPEFLALPFLHGTLETNEVILNELTRKITTKSFREKRIPLWIEEQESEAIAKFLTLVKKMSVEELDVYIEKSQNFPEIRAMFLEYKNRLYSAEALEKKEEIQMEKEFGLREKTLADYRKDFRIAKDGDVYSITGYKSENETVFIPGNINGLPVKIGFLAFSWNVKNNSKIKAVYMEEGVLDIGDNAFHQCENLQTVMLPESLMSIGDVAFAYCERLQTISIPNNVTSIGNFAFQYCLNLEHITIPDSVKSIGNFAFGDCPKLQNITIPDSVESIGKSAFRNSPKLTIYCSETSYARKYAEQYGIPWKPVETK
ncbi:MAG: leucine-rich repeat domain-containing protein [Ruminococcaceae bacterium]|nr:leucine-rich repeat domain-containing protein [Oscillospiraceae bacterium]